MQLSMKKIKSKDPRKFYPRCVKSLLVFDSLTLKTINQCQCDMSISTNSKLLMHFTTHSAQHSFFTIGGTSGLRFGLSHSESVHPSFQPVGCSTHLVGTSAGFLLSGWIGIGFHIPPVPAVGSGRAGKTKCQCSEMFDDVMFMSTCFFTCQ